MAFRLDIHTTVTVTHISSGPSPMPTDPREAPAWLPPEELQPTEVRINRILTMPDRRVLIEACEENRDLEADAKRFLSFFLSFSGASAPAPLKEA